MPAQGKITVQNDIDQIISIVCVAYFSLFVEGKPYSFTLVFQGECLRL